LVKLRNIVLEKCLINEKTEEYSNHIYEIIMSGGLILILTVYWKCASKKERKNDLRQ